MLLQTSTQTVLPYILTISILIFSINCQTEDSFSLCHELNEYGCNPTQIPDIVELYINGIDGYTLPQNPCLFDTINMTWIFTQVDSSVLDLVTDDSYFATIPCQLLMQLPTILTGRDILYLIERDYWLGPNGVCDTENTANNAYNVTICNYTNANIIISNNTDECPNDDRCYYPFVKSNFPTNKLKQFGMCHCQESCEFRFYGGDINKLDIYNQCCIWLSLVFIIGYFINLFFELHSVKKENKKIMDLPLTFDIPFICACALLLFDIAMLLPYLIGKDFFSCETGTKAGIRASKIPHANWACFVQGSVAYVSIIAIYTYFMILSFCVWRYLQKPLSPLFGVHKKYWHLGIWTYILGLYIALAIDTPNASMGANNILGICGAHLFTKPEAYIFDWYPILITLIGFAIITPMTIYKLWKHFHYGAGSNNTQEAYGTELIHLSIRLVIYTFLLCASCICFMYIIGELLFNMDKWDRIAEEYVFCLVFETYFIDIGLDGDVDSCVLDPNNELPISVYFMQGSVVLLAAVASFVLSCSNTKYRQWKEVNNTILSRLKSVSSMDMGPTKPDLIAARSKSFDTEISTPNAASITRQVSTSVSPQQSPTKSGRNKSNIETNKSISPPPPLNIQSDDIEMTTV